MKQCTHCVTPRVTSEAAMRTSLANGSFRVGLKHWEHEGPVASPRGRLVLPYGSVVEQTIEAVPDAEYWLRFEGRGPESGGPAPLGSVARVELLRADDTVAYGRDFARGDGFRYGSVFVTAKTDRLSVHLTGEGMFRGIGLDRALGPVSLVNGDFAQGLTGWTPSGADTVVEDGVLRFAAPSRAVSQRVRVQPERGYRLTFRTRAPADGSTVVEVHEQRGRLAEFVCRGTGDWVEHTYEIDNLADHVDIVLRPGGYEGEFADVVITRANRPEQA